MLNLSKPILYLITRGATDETTTTESAEFHQLLGQFSAAITAGIQLIQIREKRLTSRVLFELTSRAAIITQGTATRVLVNDRADIAAGAGADGVHLTTQSLEAAVVRQAFGERILIGSSTHSVGEARRARDAGADFIVFGPVFESPSKREYGPPVGLQALSNVVGEVAPFPVIALGGITTDNAVQCLCAGASGIAGISLFGEPESLAIVATVIKQSVKGVAS
ncbi:MAG TPA: thiamine phosphate synthase [Pyrinomonadaceae bacterium]|nr:thiamine phosphate synthase [Pyrinomonadaceae bacterium]